MQIIHSCTCAMGWRNLLPEDENKFSSNGCEFLSKILNMYCTLVSVPDDKTLFNSIILKVDKVMPYYTQPQHVDAINLDVHSKNINS